MNLERGKCDPFQFHILSEVKLLFVKMWTRPSHCVASPWQMQTPTRHDHYSQGKEEVTAHVLMWLRCCVRNKQFMVPGLGPGNMCLTQHISCFTWSKHFPPFSEFTTEIEQISKDQRLIANEGRQWGFAGDKKLFQSTLRSSLLLHETDQSVYMAL